MRKHVMALFLAATLAGCSTSEKLVERSSTPTMTSGYVGGNFTIKEYPFATAFVLTNVESSEEYILPFTTQRSFDAGHNETSLIELPKGTYRATHWIVFNAFWGQNIGSREFKAMLKPSKFTEPFKVNGGEIVFLGKFITNSKWTPGYLSSTTRGWWEAERLSEARAKDLLKDAYPTYAALRFSCLHCALN